MRDVSTRVLMRRCSFQVGVPDWVSHLKLGEIAAHLVGVLKERHEEVEVEALMEHGRPVLFVNNLRAQLNADLIRIRIEHEVGELLRAVPEASR